MSEPAKKYDVGIVGLGYVGLTLATVLAESGSSVIGVETRPEIVEMTNQGIPHFTETGLPDALSGVTRSGKLRAAERFDGSFTCDTYIITVGTPLSADGVARVDMIEAAARDIAANMRDGALVILRSTVKVGTTRDVVAPALAESGKQFDSRDVPERTLEGKALQELRELPQIVGADEQAVADRAAALFRRLTNSIVQVSGGVETAEIIKLVSNTFRDVQFAFANEVARLCDAFGVNAHEVIASGKLGYSRTNIPMPGLVGGPCLEKKDPHILMESARTRGVHLEMTSAGRMINERQPQETVRFISTEINRRKLSERGTAEDQPGRHGVQGPARDQRPARVDVDQGARPVAQGASGSRDRPVRPPRHLPPGSAGRGVSGRPGVQPVRGRGERGGVGRGDRQQPSVARPDLAAHDQRVHQPDGFIFDYWNHFSHLPKSELGGDSYFAVGNSGWVPVDV